MRLTKEESRALAFIAGMIGLSILGRWADRPLPLTTDLAAINIDSLATASLAATPRKGRSKKPPAKPPKAVARAPAVPAVAARAPAAAPPVQPMDINRATIEELDRIKGIGPVLAARIVAYRDSAGRFPNVDALTGVKGVGPAMLERLRPYVRVP